MTEEIVIKMCTECGRYTTPKCKDCNAELKINKIFNTAMCPNGHGYFDIKWKQRNVLNMSGLDEQDNFAPECPKCKRCHEWYIGNGMWMLTKRSIELRELKYPLICMYRPKPMLSEVKGTFHCNGCYNKYEKGSVIRERIYKVFLNQKGKKYHTSGATGNESYKVW